MESKECRRVVWRHVWSSRAVDGVTADQLGCMGPAAVDGHSSCRSQGRLPQLVIASIVACLLVCVLSFHAVPTAYGSLAVVSDSSVFGQAQAGLVGQTTTWYDFRGSPTNNAITDASTPRTKKEAGLLWSVKFDEGYVSPEIIVDDEVIVTSGRGTAGVISKYNKKTGKLIAKASMRNASSFSLIPPTYADGKVFVTLSDGAMEAFDVKTLKSIWYYQNALGGQGNSQIVYSDGRVYTGYWSSEVAERSYVCLDAETGKLVWEITNLGGYYWAGGLVVGDYLLFGCDDGAPAGVTGTSYVRCVEKATGKVVSSVKVKGDQRSSIVYDSALSRIYFTSKPGYLYSAQLNEATGRLSGLQSLKIDVESTATPLVYDDRVYVGGSSGGFASGTLSVVDASSFELLYQLDGTSGINGAVKSAPLISTAYADASTADGDGRLYLYLTVNNPPGGITMVSVEPHSTEASQAKATALFTPPKDMQQYCIASVICDDDGNLYYRNDSNCAMCVGVGGKQGGDDPPPDDGGDDSPSDDGGPAYQGVGYNQNTGSGATAARTSTTRPSSSTSSKASSSASSASSRAVSDKESNATGKESTRHTDAETASERLDDAPEEGLPPWLVPALIASAAIAALAALIIVRVVSARRAQAGGQGAASDGASSVAEKPDDPHGA